jgi:Membrane protein involved in the export of O-antigen and teichoic acid
VLILTGIYFAAVLVASIPLAVLRGLQRFDLINAVVAASVLISAAVYVIVLALGGGVVQLVSAVLILEILVQVPFVIVIRRIGPWLHADGLLPTRETMRVLLTYGSTRSLIRLGTVVRSRSDELILGVLAPVAVVGPYAICRRFAVAPSMLTSQLVDVILPMSSQLSAADETQRLRDLTLAGIRLSMALMLVFGVGIAFLAHPFLRAWVGAPYAVYAAVAPVFVATALLDTVQATVAAIVGGIGRQSAAAKASTIGAAVKVALGIALYKTVGGRGRRVRRTRGRRTDDRVATPRSCTAPAPHVHDGGRSRSAGHIVAVVARVWHRLCAFAHLLADRIAEHLRDRGRRRHRLFGGLFVVRLHARRAGRCQGGRGTPTPAPDKVVGACDLAHHHLNGEPRPNSGPRSCDDA